MQQRPLLDLLGARWTLAVPVAGAAWDEAGALAGFALADGTLAIALASWEGGPQIAQRSGGGLELVPAREPPRPVTRVAAPHGASHRIAAAPGGGFVMGGESGGLGRISAEGLPLPALPVAAAGPIAALARAPDSTLLAIGRAGGVMLAMPDGTTQVLALNGVPQALACAPGGQLAAWTAQDGLQWWPAAGAAAIALPGCPAPPLALGFMDGGRRLAAAGGLRPLWWRLSPTPDAPVGCGLPGRDPVGMVAGNPRRPVLAAGYRNGTVVLCQPAGDDVVFLRGAGGGAITALAWSGDGERLAIGTDTGEIAVLALPAALFRTEAAV